MMRLLLILSRPPYASAAAKETLDVALACAAFDIKVTLLLSGDAPWVFTQTQQPEAGQKNIGRLFEVLPLYDIDEIWIEQAALNRCGLQQSDLILPTQLIKSNAIAKLIGQHDQVIRF